MIDLNAHSERLNAIYTRIDGNMGDPDLEADLVAYGYTRALHKNFAHIAQTKKATPGALNATLAPLRACYTMRIARAENKRDEALMMQEALERQVTPLYGGRLNENAEEIARGHSWRVHDFNNAVMGYQEIIANIDAVLHATRPATSPARSNVVKLRPKTPKTP